MVRMLDAMVLYNPNLVLASGLMVRTRDATVHYNPNLILTSGLMVRTRDTMVHYSPNLVLTSGLMVRTKGGGGYVGLPRKQNKPAMQEVAAHCASPPLGVGVEGRGYHVFTMFSIWTQAGDRNPRARA